MLAASVSFSTERECGVPSDSKKKKKIEWETKELNNRTGLVVHATINVLFAYEMFPEKILQAT